MAESRGLGDVYKRQFLARGLSSVEKLAAEGDEEADMDFAWVPLAEAVERILAGEIVNSIAVAGILAAYACVQEGRTARSVDAPFELRPQSLAQRRPGPDLKKL